MSTNRARALAYAASVLDQKKARASARPDNFGSKKPGPPSYAFQDQQRGPVDDIADETAKLRQEEKDIEHDAEKDVVDAKDFTPGPTTGKAPQRAKTTVAPAAPQTELKSAFAKCWTIVDDIDIPAVTHDEKSWFLPTIISLFEVLFSMEEILSGNEELRWVSPNYFSLPVRVYYAVIVYVQILRSKEQAGKLSKPEGSWLRAFFRRFKDTSCPVAGPIVPILSNIVACLPDDDQFDFVTPSMPAKGLHSTASDGASPPRFTTSVSSYNHILPNVPLVASILRTFCTATALGTEHFDQSGQFVPFTLSTGGNLAGVVFPPHTNGTVNRMVSKLLNNPTIAHPLPEGKERLKEIHGFWKRSKARHIPDLPANTVYDPTGPSDITLLIDDFDWFQPCVDMATIQIKFFSDSTNISAIPTIGGMSSLVLSYLSFKDKETIPNSIDEWYPDNFSSTKARFDSTAADLQLDHKYEAAYALTNSVLEWKDTNGQPIGSKASSARDGPYWDNEKYTYKLDHPRQIMTGIHSMIQTQFYNAHGNA
jgi:hypothetical protein